MVGGFDVTSVWHRFFATLILAAAVVHVRVGRQAGVADRAGRASDWKQVIFGPDSPVPTVRDARDALGMLRWFLALGRKPRFERWTYWEKFDYWAVCLAMLLIGGSGPAAVVPHAGHPRSAGRRSERGPGAALGNGRAGRRLPVPDALLQYPLAAGEVPDGSLGGHRSGERRASAAGAAGVPGTAAAGRQAAADAGRGAVPQAAAVGSSWAACW